MLKYFYITINCILQKLTNKLHTLNTKNHCVNHTPLFLLKNEMSGQLKSTVST